MNAAKPPGRSVLIVDDEFDLANTLRAILEAEGYAPEVYSDGRQAVRRLTAGALPAPDLVLMDVMMPLASGLDVLRTMRSTPGLGGTPVILMSVVTPTVDKAEYRWDAFLRKPFTLQAVLKAVHQHLRADAAARE